MPMPRVPIEELKHRKYLTAGEAARVYGRGREALSWAFDRGLLRGYATPHHMRDGRVVGRRYILAASIDAWMELGCPAAAEGDAPPGRHDHMRQCVQDAIDAQTAEEGT